MALCDISFEISNLETPIGTALMDRLSQMGRCNRHVEAQLRHCGNWTELTKALDHTFIIPVDEAFHFIGEDVYGKLDSEDGKKQLAELYKRPLVLRENCHVLASRLLYRCQSSEQRRAGRRA